MNTIGYAVCASPKGVEVKSNGLFRDLNIDSCLYLDNKIVKLSKGQNLVYLERLSSNGNHSGRLDVILVSLYGYGISEYRKSSFIGSAIAFKDFQANTTKFKDGLYSLFNQISKIINEENRIKFQNPNEWNVSLPDSSKDYGMQTNERLNFQPIRSTYHSNVVQISNLQAELPVLLNHFMLNNALHHINKLYVTVNDALTQSIVDNGIKALPFSAFFNYDESIQYYKNALDSIKKEGAKLKNNNINLENKKKQLENDYNTLNNEKNELIKSIDTLQKKENENKEQCKKSENRLAELKNEIRKEEPIKNANPNSSEVKKYKELVKKASTVLKVVNHNDDLKYSDDESVILNNYKKLSNLKNELKMKRLFLIGLFSYFFLSLILVLIIGIKKFKTDNKYNSSINQTNKPIEEAAIDTPKIDDSILIIEELKEIDGDNVTIDTLAYHNQKIKEAFSLINSKDLSIDHELYQYVVNREWRFWELIHGENDLTNDFTQLFNNYLETKFGITEFYFDDLYELYQNENIVEEQKEIIEKRLNNYYFLDIPIENLKYLGSAKISYDKKGKTYQTIFDPYVDEDNDLYQEVNDSYKEDKEVLLKHFAYIIKNEKLNEGADLENLQVIFLPYIK